MKFNLDNLVEEYSDLETQLGDPEIFKDQKKVRDVSARKKSIEEAVNLYKEYKAVNEALWENKECSRVKKMKKWRRCLKKRLKK